MRSGEDKAVACSCCGALAAAALVSGTAMLESSALAFDSAALAFTASGQSISGEDVPPNSLIMLMAEVRGWRPGSARKLKSGVGIAGVRDLTADFADLTGGFEAALCLAQQS